ncbi:hypothetical protein D9615_006857 [Tricholomella constricta]|uniref:Major facilitator superfamily (MFS) profile domain-containing protein n=1 Tax=Tricholomella constricta TaxID=117010 RepID=A0A8H5H8W3_9AGAR|nr:hypothetical protein D9615_006857 [Tricholomella constricta]
MTIPTSPADTVVESHSPSNSSVNEALGVENRHYSTDLGFIPIPRRLRYDVNKPFRFSLVLNLAFGFASTFTVANLYWCQPLLIKLSESFQVSYGDVSRIPTLLQAGYAVGLLLISPLGDLVRRRQLILCIVSLSASLTIGLALTNSLVVFETLSFLVGVVTVTPMVLLPLAADLAPPKRQATAISVVLSGLLFGILIARVLAGIIAQYASWRVVYYLAIAVQYLVVIGSYLIIPDYPSKNKDLTYWDILRTMAKFTVTEPLLIQACLINIGSSACFTNFWVTLTFLLGGPPYNYSTLVIGLFGLVGMLGVAAGPLIARSTENLVPWYASLISVVIMTFVQVLQVAAGGIHISAVVIVAFALDVLRQMLQVSLSTAVFGISVNARARLNAVLVISLFIGQVLGTAVGTEVFIKYGWRACAALSMGWYGWQLLILLLRGPHCARYTWFGYQGGLEAQKVVEEKKAEEAAEHGVGLHRSPLEIEKGRSGGTADSRAPESAK